MLVFISYAINFKIFCFIILSFRIGFPNSKFFHKSFVAQLYIYADGFSIRCSGSKQHLYFGK